MGTKGIFFNLNHLQWFSQFIPIHLNTYVIVLEIFNSFSTGIVFIRQNVTSADVTF